jgi:hypothetical protein
LSLPCACIVALCEPSSTFSIASLPAYAAVVGPILIVSAPT